MEHLCCMSAGIAYSFGHLSAPLVDALILENNIFPKLSVIFRGFFFALRILVYLSTSSFIFISMHIYMNISTN